MIVIAIHPTDICPSNEDGCAAVLVHSTKFFGQSKRTVYSVRRKRLTDNPHPGGCDTIRIALRVF